MTAAKTGHKYMNLNRAISKLLVCYERHTQRRTAHYIDELLQERRNSNALAMELRLSCTNPSIYLVLDSYWTNSGPGHLSDQDIN